MDGSGPNWDHQWWNQAGRFWMWAIWCSTGKILISGDLIILRDSAECGDGKDLFGLTCDGEFTWICELDEELFELAGDFKLDAVTVCA